MLLLLLITATKDQAQMPHSDMRSREVKSASISLTVQISYRSSARTF